MVSEAEDWTVDTGKDHAMRRGTSTSAEDVDFGGNNYYNGSTDETRGMDNLGYSTNSNDDWKRS